MVVRVALVTFLFLLLPHSRCREFLWGTPFAGVAPAPHQAENDVPQPHDFVACGLTKTKPCCIKVS